MQKIIYRTLRAVHRVFLASNSLNDAATTFKVNIDAIINNLSKIHYINEHEQLQPLTFHAMKNLWPDEQSAEVAWGAAYDQQIHALILDLNQITMRKLHQIFLCSSSLNDAAKKLGIYSPILGRHLGKTSYITETWLEEPLTFEVMITQWPTEESAFKYWGNAYDQPMSTTTVDLKQKTMHAIHQIILSSNSLADAAEKLGINCTSLNIHLAKTKYHNEKDQQLPLTYQIMKTQWPTEESAFAYWGDDYDQPMNTASVDLKQKAMHEIHQAIISSSSSHDAAGKLGVHQKALHRHLGRTNYFNEKNQQLPLTYQIIKTQWPTEESAFAYWGDIYYQPMNTTAVNLKQKTLHEIHQIILSSNSIADTAGKLGVNQNTLNMHLGRALYYNQEGQQEPLTFDIMKTQWPTEESAFTYWGDVYHQPMHTTAVDLKQKTMHAIHQTILSSNSLADTARKIGVSYKALNTHLRKTNYINQEGKKKPLTFQIMKTLWPTEQSALAYWDDAYDQPMSTTTFDLRQKTMRAIHRIFLSSQSLTDAAGTMGVHYDTIKIHLSKTSYYDEEDQLIQLTFQMMKTQWPTEDSAFAYWGEAYDQPMNCIAVNLNQKTIRMIHRIILSSNSLSDAAGKLGVSHVTLNRHLGRANYYNEEGQKIHLTFQMMKTQWPTEESAFAYWGEDYDQPINTTVVDLKQKTMRSIHRIILSSNSLYDAADTMCVCYSTLNLHLGKTTYYNEKGQQIHLTFQIMKTIWPTEESAFAYWGDAYHQPMNTMTANLKQETMHTIHQIFLSSQSLTDAAGTLGVHYDTLNMHLSRANYYEEDGQKIHLTFQMMKTRWPTEESAFAYWGEAYDQPINTTVVDLKQKTMRSIHRIILSSNSLASAAGTLGVNDITLKRHLGKTNYYNEEGQQIPLTFKIMKSQWPTEESAFVYWGEAYYRTMNTTTAINLKQKTMRAIHRIVLSSNSHSDAAGRLGVHYVTLNMHLIRANYQNKEGQKIPLTFQLMKTQWPTEESAFAYWGEDYDQPIKTMTVDLKQKTMNVVHRIILSSKSLSDAAETLTVSDTALKRHLGKTNYFNEGGQQVPLTFKIMKTKWPTEESAFTYWGDAYYQPFVPTNNNSASKKRKNYADEPLKKSKLCFFKPTTPENEYEEVYTELLRLHEL